MIEGEQSIDVTAINPDPVGIDTLNGDLRAQVEKMMVGWMVGRVSISMISRKRGRVPPVTSRLTKNKY